MDATILNPEGTFDSERIGKKPKLSLSKVCLVAYIGEHCIFVVDLNGDEDRISKIKVSGFGWVRFFARESAIYVYDSSSGRHDVSIYSYNIPKNIFESSDVVLDKSRMKKEIALQFPKAFAKSLNYGKKVLVFSCVMKLHDKSDPNEGDFELYDPQVNETQVLPELCVTRSYKFFDGMSQLYIQLPELEGNRNSFILEGFGLVGDHTFLAHTELGIFELNLKSPIYWRMYEDEVAHHNAPFFVMENSRNRICLDAYGAYELRELDKDTKLLLWQNNIAPRSFLTPDGLSELLEEIKRDVDSGNSDVLKRACELNRRIPFMPDSQLCDSFLTLVDDNAACLVQAVNENMDEDRNPDVTIFHLKFDFSMFPILDFSKNLDEHIDELLWQDGAWAWVNQVKSFDGAWAWVNQVKSFKLPSHFFGKMLPRIVDVFPLQI